MHDFLPQLSGIDVLRVFRCIGVDGILLLINRSVFYGVHKSVIDFHRNIGSGNFSLLQFCIDKIFCIRMFNRYTQHKCTATAVLCHFARGVGISFHKRNQAGGRKRRILNGGSLGANMRQIVPHAATTLHQLYLFFIDTDDCPVRIGAATHTDHKTVRQRCYLKIVSDSRHRASLWNNVLKPVKQIEQLFFTQWVSIFFFDSSHLVCQSPMHILRRFLVDVAFTVLQSILAYPNFCCQFIAFKILQR